MTTEVGSKTKAGFSALAIFIFGLAFVEFQTPDKYLGIALFAVAAILAFFAIIIDIPMVDLPKDLQDLKKDLESGDVSKIMAYVEAHESEVEALIKELSTTDLQELLSELEQYLPDILPVLSAMAKEVKAENIDVSKIDWKKVLKP